MSRRKYPRSIASRYPRRFVTPSPGSSSRMSRRKLERRCVTALRWTLTVTPARMWSPPRMITSPATDPLSTSLRLRPQITRLRLRVTAPRPPRPATALQTSTGRPKPPRPRDTAPRPPPTTDTRGWSHRGEWRVQSLKCNLMDICIFQAVFWILSKFSDNKCGQLGSGSGLNEGGVISG